MKLKYIYMHRARQVAIIHYCLEEYVIYLSFYLLINHTCIQHLNLYIFFKYLLSFTIVFILSSAYLLINMNINIKENNWKVTLNALCKTYENETQPGPEWPSNIHNPDTNIPPMSRHKSTLLHGLVKHVLTTSVNGTLVIQSIGPAVSPLLWTGYVAGPTQIQLQHLLFTIKIKFTALVFT